MLQWYQLLYLRLWIEKIHLLFISYLSFLYSSIVYIPSLNSSKSYYSLYFIISYYYFIISNYLVSSYFINTSLEIWLVYWFYYI